jgi:hypothetical protein
MLQCCFQELTDTHTQYSDKAEGLMTVVSVLSAGYHGLLAVKQLEHVAEPPASADVH